MKKCRRKPSAPAIEIKSLRKNQEIRVPEVRFIDPDNGLNEVMDIEKALKIAEEEELDLVEVSPLANPPVVKLINYDSYRYQQKKLILKQKQSIKKTEVKGMRLSPRIDENDLNTKVKQGLKFLEKGHKVKLDILLRGREAQHSEMAIGVIQSYIDKIQENININVEQSPQKIGRLITAIIGAKS
ncbi:MAG TPA: translation initiation factor IF-3 [bacterium]|nr:translation initiation factor IF-3 [bacterium]